MLAQRSIIFYGTQSHVTLAYAVSVLQTMFSSISEETLALTKSMANGPRNNQVNHFLHFKRRNATFISADDER
jgi:hypothetical protein